MDTPNIFHNVVAYTGKEKAAANQRLVAITFKTPSDKALAKLGIKKSDYIKPQNRCVSIPIHKVVASPDILQEALQAAFDNLQDDCIRSLIVTGDTNKKAKLTVSDDEISFESVAQFAKETGSDGKLSGESVNNWFLENLSEKLQVALANALKISNTPSDEEVATLEGAVMEHSKLLAKLAAPKAILPQHIAESLLKAVNLAEPDHIQISLKNKLEKLTKPETITLLGL